MCLSQHFLFFFLTRKQQCTLQAIYGSVYNKKRWGQGDKYASKGKEIDEITHTTRRLFISSEIGMYIQNTVTEYACTRILLQG